MKKRPKHSEDLFLIQKISTSDLTTALSKLRYDALAGFLWELAVKLDIDGQLDRSAGKVRLGKSLQAASSHIRSARREVDNAWKICKSHMDKE